MAGRPPPPPERGPHDGRAGRLLAPPPPVPVNVPDAPAPGPQGRPAGREGWLLLLVLTPAAAAAVVAGHGAADPKLPTATAAAGGPSHILGAREGGAALAAAAGTLHHTHIMAPRERRRKKEKKKDGADRGGGGGQAGRPAGLVHWQQPRAPRPTPLPERAGERTPTSRHACLTRCSQEHQAMSRHCRKRAGCLARAGRRVPLSMCRSPGRQPRESSQSPRTVTHTHTHTRRAGMTSGQGSVSSFTPLI